MNVTMVTPWGTKCGIAAYSRSLTDSVRAHDVRFTILAEYDSPAEHSESIDTIGCWRRYSDDISGLVRELHDVKGDVIHIQLQWFHSPHVVGELLDAATSTGQPVIVQFHNTLADGGDTVALETILGQLGSVHLIIVHSESDRARLIGFGLGAKVVLLPLGQADHPSEDIVSVRRALEIADRRPVLGSFGYLLPHKGVRETIQAVSLLKRRYPSVLYIAACAFYPHAMSAFYWQECRSTIEELHLGGNVALVTDFLPERVAVTLLSACDVLTLPYLPTTESASAAVRFSLSAHRPIIVTDREIFSSVGPATLTIEDSSPQSIAQGVEAVLDDHDLAARLVDAGEKLAATSSWSAVGKRYWELLRSVCQSSC